ncbi:MAG: Kelch repeat-containing protein [Candidatus Eiseniibacteriota bacterium]
MDGSWEEFPPLVRYGHQVVFDSHRRRMILIGGRGESGNYPTAVWTLDLNAESSWERLPAAGDLIPGFVGHSAVYDPVRDRVFVVSGYDPTVGFVLDLWVLELDRDPAVWRRITSSGPKPSARQGQSAVYDPVGDRILVFGGLLGNQFQNDTWSLSLAGEPTWALVQTPGPGPGRRAFHAAALDEQRKRMLIFGGSFEESDEVWALDLSNVPLWERVSTAGIPPSPRYASLAVFDSRSDRLLILGGDFREPQMDTWELSFSDSEPQWGPLPVLGAKPPGRDYHSGILDPINYRVIVFGGIVDDPQQAYASDLWSLSLDANYVWERLLEAPAPRGRAFHATICDPPRDRLLMFGGVDQNQRLGDLWSWNLQDDSGWSRLSPAGEPPDPGGYVGVHDPIRDRMLLFWDQSGSPEDYKIWALDLSGDGQWTRLDPEGERPEARHGAAVLYDPVRDRILVLGGFVGTTTEVWALEMEPSATWIRLDPIGPSPTRRAHWKGCYDERRDRMVLFGGLGPWNETWALDLADTPRWELLSPTGEPPFARYHHSAVYDPVDDRMIAFSGIRTGAGSYADTWALRFSPELRWEELDPPGNPPWRGVQTAHFDPARDRMLVIGGMNSTGRLSSVWSLRWDRPETILRIDPVVGNPRNDLPPSPNGARFVGAFSEAGLSSSEIDFATLLVNGWPVERGRDGGPSVKFRDLDRDGLPDAVLQIPTEARQSQHSSREVVLQGSTLTGARIRGSASIVVRGDPDLEVESESGQIQTADSDLARFGGSHSLTLFSVVIKEGMLIAGYSIPGGDVGSLDVFDVRGRQVLQHELSSGPQGRREIRIVVKDAMPPGIYFARLKVASAARFLKFVAVR